MLLYCFETITIADSTIIRTYGYSSWCILVACDMLYQIPKLTFVGFIALSHLYEIS